MTYDRHSTYLTWGGNIGASGNDQWQCGVHLTLDPSLDGPGLPSQEALDTLLGGPLTNFHQHPDCRISPLATLTWAKAAQMDPSGHYTTDPILQNQTAIPGGSTGDSKGGPQLAGVVTLWSGSQLGHANYGRFYVPMWEAALSETAHVFLPHVTDLLGRAKTLVQAINTWAAAELSATAKIRIMSKLGAGTTRTPTVIRVGDVKDTQQRRRRQLHEMYLTSAL